MAPLQIVHYPDPILTTRTAEIEEITDETVSLAHEMLEAMYKARGVGLAAPQIGKGVRLSVINLTDKADGERILINPRIVEKGDEEVLEEGCLSVPGVSVKLPRPRWVKVLAYDVDGDEIEIEAEGVLARALQHEVDHLDGVLFIAKLSPAQRLQVASRLKELERRFQDNR